MPTILVIDDNDDFRAYLTVLLDRRGYDVLALRSGRGLEPIVRSRQIDAVITDLYMPEVDGLEVVTFFNRYDPAIPVFGITGSAGEGDMVCVRAMSTFGAREVFTKPFDSARLLSALDRALNHSSDDRQGSFELVFGDDGNRSSW